MYVIIFSIIKIMMGEINMSAFSRKKYAYKVFIITLVCLLIFQLSIPRANIVEAANDTQELQNDNSELQPLDYEVVTESVGWVFNVIDGDLYIGPEAVLTINGNVTIDGDIYVLGALVSYGTLNVNGTIHAKRVSFSSSNQPLYNGTVHFRGGQNNFKSIRTSSQPIDDIPIEIYTNPIIATNGEIDIIEGATLPIADMYVEEEKVELNRNGTFTLKDVNVGQKQRITFTFIDVFGATITKEFPLQIIDTIPPTVTIDTKGGYYGTPKAISLEISEAGTIYYTVNGEDPTPSSNKYTEPITIKEDTVLRYMAVDKSGNQSEIYTERYTFFHVNEITDQSTQITGQAQPNSTIVIYDGKNELTSIANQEGEFAIEITPYTANSILKIYAIDEQGTKSEIIEVKVKDITAPEKPKVNEVTDQSTEVTGEAEARSTVIVKVDKEELGRTSAGEDGSFTVKIIPQKANTKLSIYAVDDSGNESEATVVTVKDVTPPEKPIVDEVTEKSSSVTGKAEADSTIEVKANGKVIGSGKAKADGTFSVTIPVQKAGTTLSVTATDKAGNVSESTVVTVKDVTPPEKPTVNEVTDKSTTVTGRAEADSTIEVKANGKVIGSGIAKADGTFSVTIPVQKAGTTLSVTATDKAGNVSESTVVTVKDVTPPEKPTVDEVTDKSTTVTGKAEAGSTIEVKANGKVIGSGTAKADGTFSVTIPVQKVGTKLTITAKDKAGNISEETIIIVNEAKYEPSKDTNNKRIAGDSRYHTAVQVSQHGWEKDSTETVIIARGDSFPDALAGAVLAYENDAPILLVDDRLLSVTKNEIERLGAKKAIVLGGTAAVSNEVVSQLKELGLTVDRAAGGGRYETAVAVANKLEKKSDTVVLAYGLNFPDALAIAPYAAEEGYPILLTEKDKLSNATREYLANNKEIKNIIIVGGQGVISKNVQDELKGYKVERIDGQHRYDTAAKIAAKFGTPSKAYIANGNSFADALTGAVLAAKEGAPLLLVETDKLPSATQNVIKDIDTFTFLGGEAVITEKLKNQILR